MYVCTFVSYFVPEVGNQMQYITLRSTTGVNTYAVPRTDDGSSLVVRIPSGLPIGSSLHTTVYVSLHFCVVECHLNAC